MNRPPFRCEFEVRCRTFGTAFGTLTRMCNRNGEMLTCTFNGETRQLMAPNASSGFMPWLYCYEEELPRGLNRNGYE